MTVDTQWLHILKDGQPPHPGWYEITYYPDGGEIYRRYWSGQSWLFEKNKRPCMFGNGELFGNECYRGLAQKGLQ